MKIEFESLVGDDIPVVIAGSYFEADESVGYGGAFDIEAIYIKADVKRECNIESLFQVNSTWKRLESEGMRAGEKFIEGRGK